MHDNLTIDHTLEDWVPAKTVRDAAKARHGEHDQTPGYYLRLYRHLADPD